jgi:hypothetical protein
MATITNPTYEGSNQPNTFFKDVVFPSGASGVTFDLQGNKLAGIAFPSGMANTTYLASLSIDDGGTQVSFLVTTGASRYCGLQPADSATLQGLVRIAGTATETANRTLKIVYRPY